MLREVSDPHRCATVIPPIETAARISSSWPHLHTTSRSSGEEDHRTVVAVPLNVMVDWAEVEWSDDVAPFHEVDDLDGDGCEFYAVLSAAPVPGKKREWQRPYQLLYIGLAYRQTVHVRIKQDHRSYDLLFRYFSEHRKERDVIVMLGILTAYSAERVTKALVEDIEALVIYENQPKFNARNKNRYNGRPLVVVSTGDREPIKMFASSSGKAFTAWNSAGGRAEWEEQREDERDGEADDDE